MPNYNTIITQEDDTLPCTQAEFDHLNNLLDADEEEYSGFALVLEDGNLFLEAEESGTLEALSEGFLKAYGALLQKNNRPFMEFGVAFTCSRLIPGSHGGTAFRIYADGRIVNRVESWPNE